MWFVKIRAWILWKILLLIEEGEYDISIIFILKHILNHSDIRKNLGFKNESFHSHQDVFTTNMGSTVYGSMIISRIRLTRLNLTCP